MSLQISVITPNFNYGKYLQRCLESVAQQNYENWEHLIIDGGSTDNSLKIVESFTTHYSGKTKLIKQTQRKGQTNAINLGLQNAKGDIYGWLNSDDYYCDDIFTTVANIFEKNDNLEAIYGEIFLVNSQENVIRKNRYLKFDYNSGIFNGFGRMIPCGGIFWRSKLTKEVGLLDEQFDYAMDGEYWSRLFYKRKLKYISTPLACWRLHEEAKTFDRQQKENKAYRLAENENQIIAERAYQNLALAKILPYKKSGLVFAWYYFKRRFLRLMKGHYNYKIFSGKS